MADGEMADADHDGSDEDMTDEMSDEDMTDDMADEDMTDDTDEAELAFGDGEIGPYFGFLFGSAGIEPDDALLDCIEGRGVDLGLGIDGGESDDEFAAAALALMACDPELLAILTVENSELPPGTDPALAECVLTVAYDELASLPEDEAIALLDEDDVPDDVIDATTAVAADECGVDESEIAAILESL